MARRSAIKIVRIKQRVAIGTVLRARIAFPRFVSSDIINRETKSEERDVASFMLEFVHFPCRWKLAQYMEVRSRNLPMD